LAGFAVVWRNEHKPLLQMGFCTFDARHGLHQFGSLYMPLSPRRVPDFAPFLWRGQSGIRGGHWHHRFIRSSSRSSGARCETEHRPPLLRAGLAAVADAGVVLVRDETNHKISVPLVRRPYMRCPVPERPKSSLAYRTPEEYAAACSRLTSRMGGTPAARPSSRRFPTGNPTPD
jgi:hypothetical protein